MPVSRRFPSGNIKTTSEPTSWNTRMFFHRLLTDSNNRICIYIYIHMYVALCLLYIFILNLGDVGETGKFSQIKYAIRLRIPRARFSDDLTPPDQNFLLERHFRLPRPARAVFTIPHVLPKLSQLLYPTSLLLVALLVSCLYPFLSWSFSPYSPFSNPLSAPLVFLHG